MMSLVAVLVGLVSGGVVTSGPQVDWKLAGAGNAPFRIADLKASASPTAITLTLALESLSDEDINSVGIFLGIFGSGTKLEGGRSFSKAMALPAHGEARLTYNLAIGGRMVTPVGTVVVAPSEASLPDRVWRVRVESLQLLSPINPDAGVEGEYAAQSANTPHATTLDLEQSEAFASERSGAVEEQCSICDNCFQWAQACGRRVNGMGYCTGQPCISSYFCHCEANGGGDCSFTCSESNCC